MSRFNKLSKDALFSIAIMLDLPDLLRFCDSNERVDELICQRNEIWYNKLVKEFPNWKEFNIDKDLKDIYETLYGLKIVKEFLNETNSYYDNFSLLEIYNLESLFLDDIHLTEIPEEIGNLTKLQTLNLSNNNLTEIPKEIGNLTKLKDFDLINNKLIEIPKEIGNLTNLEKLFLYGNNLTEIPKELGNLTKLKYLSLSNNKLIEIPKEVREIKGLRFIKE